MHESGTKINVFNNVAEMFTKWRIWYSLGRLVSVVMWLLEWQLNDVIRVDICSGLMGIKDA